MDGVLVVDKPQGITSHDVVAVVRRSLRERRIGHTGTLDPLATGVLPLACGRATRLVRFLAASDKDYRAGIRFGIATDTYDITGAPTARSETLPTRDAIESALDAFGGEYEQMPPAYSAKKIGGTRAYELARQQATVELKAVRVRVPRLELIDFTGETAIVELTCSAGFYVRSLAHELGLAVGSPACLETLRRTRSGEFGLNRAVTLEQLQDDAAVAGGMFAVDTLLGGFPMVTVSDEGRRRVSHGQEVPGGPEAPWVRLVDREGQLIAVAAPGSTPGALHPSVVLI
jgi:tRNA pseudouridine55 synthase